MADMDKSPRQPQSTQSSPGQAFSGHLTESAFNGFRSGPLTAEEAQKIYKEGLRMQASFGEVLVRFGRSGFPGYEADSPLPEVALGPGVWVERHSELTGGPHSKLPIITVLSSVEHVERYDLLLALDHLFELCDRGDDAAELKAEIEGASSSPNRLIYKDLIWEANAPISRVTSSLIQTIDALVIPERISGFGAAVVGIFTQKLTEMIGERLPLDRTEQLRLGARLGDEVRRLCDLHLSEGLNTVIRAKGDTGYLKLASDLPDLFTDWVILPYMGKRVLPARDPMDSARSSIWVK